MKHGTIIQSGGEEKDKNNGEVKIIYSRRPGGVYGTETNLGGHLEKRGDEMGGRNGWVGKMKNGKRDPFKDR